MRELKSPVGGGNAPMSWFINRYLHKEEEAQTIQSALDSGGSGRFENCQLKQSEVSRAFSWPEREKGLLTTQTR